MQFMRGILFGLIAGLIGAILWAVISYYAHMQIGIVAWLIGGMVGTGVAMGSRGNTGTETGAFAAVIALVAVLGGKYLAAYAFASNYTPPTSMITVDDAQAQRTIAHQVVDEYQKAGKTLTWPEGKTEDDADSITDFPKDVAKESGVRWRAMSADEQTAFKGKIESEMKASLVTFRGMLVNEAFKQSFGIFSIVFCGLALITAFKIGAGLSTGS